MTLHAENLKGILKRQLKETLCDEVETKWEFTYLGHRVSTGGGCEAVVTARTRCGMVKFRECGELLYDRTFPLRLKGDVYKSCIRPAMLQQCYMEVKHGVWKKVRWEFYQGQKDSWWVQCAEFLLNDWNKSTDFMFMLGLSESIDQLAMANSVHWYVLRREDGHILRKALDFEVEGKRKKWRLKTGHGKSVWGRKCEGWFEKGRCTFPIKVEFLRKSACCWVEQNLATLTCGEYYQI